MKSFFFQKQHFFKNVIFLSTVLLSFQFSGCTVFTGFFGDAGCGDGLLQIDAGEECDDGNNLDGDGCDALCLIEIEEICNEDFFVIQDATTQLNNTAGLANLSDGLCQVRQEGGGGSDVIFQVTPLITGSLDLRLTSDADLGVFVRRECVNVETEIGCVDFVDGAGAIENLSVPSIEGEILFVVVGGFDGTEAGAFSLEVASRATVCGDGFNDITEECDDGNGVDNDRCNNQCQFDTVAEIEPNDDGTPQIAQDDFDIENANGPFTQDVIIKAALDPLGDEDVFEIKNLDPNNQKTVQIETFGRGGDNVLCDNDDTNIIIRDDQGVFITDNDDINDDGFTFGFCSFLSVTLQPNQTVFLQVVDTVDTFPIPLYFIDINFL